MEKGCVITFANFCLVEAWIEIITASVETMVCDDGDLRDYLTKRGYVFMFQIGHYWCVGKEGDHSHEPWTIVNNGTDPAKAESYFARHGYNIVKHDRDQCDRDRWVIIKS